MVRGYPLLDPTILQFCDHFRVPPQQHMLPRYGSWDQAEKQLGKLFPANTSGSHRSYTASAVGPASLRGKDAFAQSPAQQSETWNMPRKHQRPIAMEKASPGSLQKK